MLEPVVDISNFAKACSNNDRAEIKRILDQSTIHSGSVPKELFESDATGIKFKLYGSQPVSLLHVAIIEIADEHLRNETIQAIFTRYPTLLDQPGTQLSLSPIMVAIYMQGESDAISSSHTGDEWKYKNREYSSTVQLLKENGATLDLNSSNGLMIREKFLDSLISRVGLVIPPPASSPSFFDKVKLFFNAFFNAVLQAVAGEEKVIAEEKNKIPGVKGGTTGKLHGVVGAAHPASYEEERKSVKELGNKGGLEPENINQPSRPFKSDGGENDIWTPKEAEKPSQKRR